MALPSPISCRFFFLAELRQTCNSLLSIPCNHYIQSLFSCLAERASDFRLSWIPSTRQSSKSLIAVNVPACLCTLRGVLSDGFLTILLRSGNSVLLCNACGDLYGEQDGFLWPPALCGNVPRKGLKMFHLTNGSGDSLFLKTLVTSNPRPKLPLYLLSVNECRCSVPVHAWPCFIAVIRVSGEQNNIYFLCEPALLALPVRWGTTCPVGLFLASVNFSCLPSKSFRAPAPCSYPGCSHSTAVQNCTAWCITSVSILSRPNRRQRNPS